MPRTKRLRKTHQMRKCMWKAGHQCQCQQQLDRISKSCFCFDPSVVAPDLLQLSPVCSTHIYVTERGVAISWNAIKVISYFLSMFKGVLLAVFPTAFQCLFFCCRLPFVFCILLLLSSQCLAQDEGCSILCDDLWTSLDFIWNIKLICSLNQSRREW